MSPSGFCGSCTGHRCLIQEHCLFFYGNNTYSKLGVVSLLVSPQSAHFLWLWYSTDAWPALWWAELWLSQRERERGVENVLDSAEWRLLPELCLISRSGRALFSINSTVISFLLSLRSLYSGWLEKTHEGLSATQHIFSASREAVKVCNYLADVNTLRFQVLVLLYTLSADHQFCCAKLKHEFLDLHALEWYFNIQNYQVKLGFL